MVTTPLDKRAITASAIDAPAITGNPRRSLMDTLGYTDLNFPPNASRKRINKIQREWGNGVVAVVSTPIAKRTSMSCSGKDRSPVRTTSSRRAIRTIARRDKIPVASLSRCLTPRPIPLVTPLVTGNRPIRLRLTGTNHADSLLGARRSLPLVNKIIQEIVGHHLSTSVDSPGSSSGTTRQLRSAGRLPKSCTRRRSPSR